MSILPAVLSWPRRALFLLAAAGLGAAIVAAAVVAPGLAKEDAQRPSAQPGSDACVLEFNLPAGATLTIDGRDFEKRKQYTFRPLVQGQPYQTHLEIRWSDGHSEQWLVPIEAGRIVRLAVETPTAAQPTVSASAATPGLQTNLTSKTSPPDAPSVTASPASPRPSPSASPADAELIAAAAGTNFLAADLYAKLSERKGNLLFSPASLETALAMTYGGARGQTAGQMASVLHLSMRPERVAPAFGQLLKSLNGAAMASTGPAPQLSVANALWAAEGFALEPVFSQQSQANYAAGVHPIDFKMGGASQKINSWVAQRTQGKITDLISSDALPPTTRLVLANAVYFKGRWSQQFEAARTTEAAFRTSPKESVLVPMMNQQGQFAYFEADGLQAVELPYTGGRLSMVVLLPDEASGLPALGEQLNDSNLRARLTQLKPETVNLSIPRFRMADQLRLNPTLAMLGMTNAFSDGADFSGISAKEGLRLSDVVHQAVIDVNEEGTEAAAATGVVVGAKSMAAGGIKVFKADHPFVFLVRDRVSSAILFLGQLVRPDR